MKKFLAVVFLCLPAFGQAAYSGLGSYSGSAAYGSFILGGAPLTYSARTDNCVTGIESGCISGTTTGESGSALIFQEGTSDPVPFYRLDTDTTPGNCSSYVPSVAADCATAGTPFVDLDFGSYAIFITDRTTTVNTTVFSMGSDGGYDAFGVGYPNDVLMTWTNSGGVKYLGHVLEANFLAHACASSKCIVLSNILGTNCTPTPGVYSGAGICTQFQIVNGGGSFSRNASDIPNTLYEANLPVITKTVVATGNTTLTGGPANDSVTRAIYVNFSNDSGGAAPCSVLPSDYKSLWTGGLVVSDGGAITMASGGGGSYQTAVPSASTVLTPDTFVMPVNNIPTPNNILHFMFQASNGTTAGALLEPNWSLSCPTQGSTCTDGSVTWTNIGPVAVQGPGFDVVHFDPLRGCSRINTRLSKLYRGVNEGVSWPSAGTPDAAGQEMTDDAVTCFRMGGTNCGAGGTVNLTDKFVLHATDQKFQSQYSVLTPTGAGGVNKNYGAGGGNWPEMSATPNGSCNTQVSYTAFATWPNMAWVSGLTYAQNKYTASLADHNIYKLTTTAYASAPSTIDPASDAANWSFAGYICYAFVVDWNSNMVRPILDFGPDFGGDGHAAQSNGFEYMGGAYWSHYYNAPNCPTTVSVYCNGTVWPTNNYVGAPNPGTRVMSVTLPSDGHPTSRNAGPGDLQPIFDATTSQPAWGGVGLPTLCGGGTNASAYCAAGYNEEIAFPPDGSQILLRFGHNYNTGSNLIFGVRWATGVISRDGKMMSYSSDFMNSRGDRLTGASTCVSPSRAQYPPRGNQTVSYLDNMQPEGNNNGIDIYQAQGFWNGSSYVLSGTGTQGANILNWNTSCPNPGDYCTVDKSNTTAPLDGNVLWKNVGPNSCRGDIALMDVTSAHAAP